MTDATQQPLEAAANSPRASRSRDAAVWAATRVAAGMHRVCGHRAPGSFGILTYHRVTEPVPGAPQPTWNVSPRQLRSQLSGLLERGFQPWPLSALLHRVARAAAPRKAFAVTFDDGYANNLLSALPVLAELRVPATVFLATAYLDGQSPFPFDDWKASGTGDVPRDAWRPLTTSECRQLMASELVELGAHTHSHQRFVGRHREFRRDLAQCVDLLLEKFGIVQPPFALPYGASTPEMIEIARQSAVSCCLSTRACLNRPTDDAFAWGRFDVADGDSASVLAAKLSGWYTAVAATGKRLIRPLSGLRRSAAVIPPTVHVRQQEAR